MGNGEGGKKLIPGLNEFCTQPKPLIPAVRHLDGTQ